MKQKHRFIAYKHKPQPREFTSETFRVAVRQAEHIVIRAIRQKGKKLGATEATVFLALCTHSVLVGKRDFDISEKEIQAIILYILNDPDYTPGSAFPYTKEQMVEAGREAS
jgi:hypothetical protein